MNDEIIEDLNERLDRTIDDGRQLLANEDMQQRLDEVRDVAEGTIRKYPIASVLTGFAVGFLIASLFRSED